MKMNELKDDDKKLQDLKNELESKYNENVNKLKVENTLLNDKLKEMNNIKESNNTLVIKNKEYQLIIEDLKNKNNKILSEENEIIKENNDLNNKVKE